jgi:predicted dehydrogenase
MAVRVGVIGVGYLGQHHARVFSGLEGTELIGITDIDSRKTGDIAKKYNCRSFSEYADLVEACDAVSIVTPTTTHHAIAMDCLKAGKDLFIEKPITERMDEAKDLIEAAEKKDLILQIGHLERYNPAIIAAIGMIHDPKFVEAERLSPFLGRGIDVDVTLDLMIHDIDIVLSIVPSTLKEIRATGGRVMTGKIDVAKAWLEFENGCKALITASRLAPEKMRKLRIYQKDSYISVDYQSQEVSRYFRKASDISFDVVKPENKEPLKEELSDFISCVESRKRPRVSGKEAMDALDVVLKINEMLNS